MIIPKEIHQKPIEYLMLLIIFIIAGILFLSFGYDNHNQRRIIYATCAGYFFWSLYHHYRRGDLHLSIIVEYLLMALLAIVVLSGTLF
jgi:hypothetical protein